MGSTPKASPSYKRRQALRDADAGNLVTVAKSSSYPLEKYFQIVDRLLFHFQQALEERRLDETYVYGIRFATFCVEQLPKHPQYNQGQFQKAKIRNARQVDRVLKTIEIINQRMDVEELVKQKKEEEEKRRIQDEEEERERQRLAKEEEEERQRLEEEAERQRLAREANRQRQSALERQKSKKIQQEKIEQSAYAKLQTMQQQQEHIEQSAYAKLQTMQQRKSNKSSRKLKSNKIQRKEVEQPTMPEKVPSKKKVVEAPTPVTPAKKKKEAVKPQPAATPPKREEAPPQRKEPPSKKKEVEQPKQEEAVVNSSKPAPKEPKPQQPPPQPRKRNPMTEEEQTIAFLESTIQKQEERLVYIEEVSIPQLLKEAKAYLSKNNQEYNRKAALHCLARKKKLENAQDSIKGAIFRMETQIFMLENAMGDRQVQEALASADEAMKGIQASVGGMDATSLQIGLEELSGQSVMTTTTTATEIMDDLEFDEHELEQELDQWTSAASVSSEDDDTISSLPSKLRISKNDDADEDISILSVPKIPAQKTTPAPTTTKMDAGKNEVKKTSSTRGLLKAVLG